MSVLDSLDLSSCPDVDHLIALLRIEVVSPRVLAKVQINTLCYGNVGDFDVWVDRLHRDGTVVVRSLFLSLVLTVAYCVLFAHL